MPVRKVLADLGPGQSPFPGSQSAAFSSPHKDTNPSMGAPPSGQGHLEAPSPDSMALELVRASVSTSGGHGQCRPVRGPERAGCSRASVPGASMRVAASLGSAP